MPTLWKCCGSVLFPSRTLLFLHSVSTLGLWEFLSFFSLFPVPLPVNPPHPHPGRSIFKPFIFTDCSTPVLRVVSPQFGPEDPVRKQPRFQSQVDRRHDLYKAHQVALSNMETNPVGTDGRPRSMIVLLEVPIHFIHTSKDFYGVLNVVIGCW